APKMTKPLGFEKPTIAPSRIDRHTDSPAPERDVRPEVSAAGTSAEVAPAPNWNSWRARTAWTPSQIKYAPPVIFSTRSAVPERWTSGPRPTDTRMTMASRPDEFPITVASPVRQPCARERLITNTTLGPGTTIKMKTAIKNALAWPRSIIVHVPLCSRQ